MLGAGHLPFWNPYHFAGTPHLADPQTTVFYPPALLLRWLPVPAFLGWMVALHLWIAGAGTLFAARVLGLGWMAAAAAGGRRDARRQRARMDPRRPSAPDVFGRLGSAGPSGLAVVSVRSGRVVPDGRLVAVLVLQFLSGYLQGTLYLAAALALYYVFSAVWPDHVERARTALDAARAARGAGECCAEPRRHFMLLPTATLCRSPVAAPVCPTETRSTAAGRSTDLATLLFPFYGLADAPPHRFLSDRLAYVGWILTAFAPFAFFRRDRLRISVFLGLLAALACALALGDAVGLFRLQYALFPGLRVPGRVLFLATFSLALLGGIGLEAFLALARNRSWRSWPYRLSSVSLSSRRRPRSSSRERVLRRSLGPGWPWMPVALAASMLAIAAAALARWPRVAACRRALAPSSSTDDAERGSCERRFP